MSRTSEMSRYWELLFVLFMVMFAVVGCRQYPDCDTDEHCEEFSEFCLNGKCAQCRQNSHCPECNQCVAGACEEVAGCCQSDSQCNGKEKCRSNRCGPECISDSDCDTGKICKADGTCQVQCVVDGDCASGESCSSGRCLAASRSSDPCDDLSSVYFDYNESALRADTRDTLREHADCIKKRSRAVLIEGHCDERGTPEYNIALGERRARSARDYMVGLGVSRNTMSMISYGEEKPAKYGSSESAWSLNRRCEFEWK